MASTAASASASAASTPTAPTAVNLVDSRFFLDALGDRAEKANIRILLKNGLYYLTIHNAVSALVSFSSAATYVYAVQQSIAAEAGKKALDPTLKAILGYVEKLQEETKGITSGSGGGGGGGGDDGKAKDGKKEDDNDDLDVQCESFGCEEDPAKNKLTFDDVIGMKKEKENFFASIVYPLIYPNLYTKSAKGVLLYGPPGTGKTYLIKAAIKELTNKFGDKVGVHFFPLTGADLKGKYVGETEMKIVRAYTCAARRACQSTDPLNLTGPKKCRTAPEAVKAILDTNKDDMKKFWKEKAKQYVSVIFIDEFDAIGGDRAKDESGMVANAVNTMLQMMDGLQSFANIVTVCATNFPWNLDAALLRRFSSQIFCNVPQIEDIDKLVKYEMKSRLKIVLDNKQTYCSRKMTKYFEPSKELRQQYKLLDKEEEAKTDKDFKKRDEDFIKMFDTSFTQDSSVEFRSCIAEMAEKRYSNSDISQMMQAAYNMVAEAALNQSTWIRIQDPTPNPDTKVRDTFWIASKLTKFKGINNDAAVKYKNALMELETMANRRSIPTLEGVKLSKNQLREQALTDAQTYYKLYKLQTYFDELQSIAKGGGGVQHGGAESAKARAFKQEASNKLNIAIQTFTEYQNEMKERLDADLESVRGLLDENGIDLIKTSLTTSRGKKQDNVKDAFTDYDNQLGYFKNALKKEPWAQKWLGTTTSSEFTTLETKINKLVKEDKDNLNKKLKEAAFAFVDAPNVRKNTAVVAAPGPTGAAPRPTVGAPASEVPPTEEEERKEEEEEEDEEAEREPGDEESKLEEGGLEQAEDNDDEEEVKEGGYRQEGGNGWIQSFKSFISRAKKDTTVPENSPAGRAQTILQDYENFYDADDTTKILTAIKAVLLPGMNASVSNLNAKRRESLEKETAARTKAEKATANAAIAKRAAEEAAASAAITPEEKARLAEVAAAAIAAATTAKKELAEAMREREAAEALAKTETVSDIFERIADPNTILIPTGVLIDKGSMKSVFGGNIPLPKVEEKDGKKYKVTTIEKQATSITFDNKTFTNIRYLFECPPILMYNDISISDLFYQAIDVDLVRSEMALAKKYKRKPNKNLEISVIFSRGYDVTYSNEEIYDKFDEIILKLKQTMGDIEALMGRSYSIPNIPENLYYYKATDDKLGAYQSADNASAGEYPVTLTGKDRYTADQQAEIIRLDKELFDNFKILWGRNLVTKPKDKIEKQYQEWAKKYFQGDKPMNKTLVLHPYEKTFLRNDRNTEGGGGVNPIWEYCKYFIALTSDPASTEKNKLDYIKEYLKENRSNEGRGLPYKIQAQPKNAEGSKKIKEDLGKFLEANELIKFLSDSEKTQLEAFKTQEATFTDSQFEDVKNITMTIAKSIEGKEKRIFDTPDKRDGKKVLYFHSKIRPFSASWVMSKSTGPYGILGGVVVNTVKAVGSGLSRFKNWAANLLAGKENLTAEQQKDLESISTRMAEARVTTARYLLVRATAVGVTSGDDDKKNYHIVTKTLESTEATAPEDPTGRERSSSNASTTASNAGSAGSSPRPTSGGSRKQTRKNGKKSNKTRKVKVQQGGGNLQDPSEIKWFDLKRTSFAGKSVAQSITFNSIIVGCVMMGVVASSGGLAALPYVGSALASAWATGGVLGTAGAIAGTAGTAGLVSAVATTANVGLKEATGGNFSFGVTDIERALFNDFLGYWNAFSSPEENVDIINLMFAMVFGDDTINLEKGRDLEGTNWYKNLPGIYSGLYEIALQNRVRKWCQIREYSQLVEKEGGGYVNLKKLVFEEDVEKPDYTTFLCYYMDASYIAAAIKTYPTTWNPITGQMLEDYNKNRTKFLEDLKKKEEKKK
jgi:SpoVK/Ycf46/Vps4 family AAA+-type ATPase